MLFKEMYEKEVRHLLADGLTYKKLDFNPFPQLVSLINEKLFFVFEVYLLTKKEFGYLRVENFNIPTFYIIPKITQE